MEREDIRPGALKAGDTVGAFGIADHVDREEIASGVEILESWGLKVRFARNLFRRNGRYDGTPGERISATQELIDDPSVRAMIATRGGYGAAQVVPFLDLSPLRSNPKWIVGFSDVTVLHIVLNNNGLESIHGHMLRHIGGDGEGISSLREALSGSPRELVAATDSYCRKGMAEGRLVGGNLSLIYSLQGTPYELDTDGAILFLEDVDEAAYSVDRMLQNLLLSGKLDRIAGLVVGQFTNYTDAGGIDPSLMEIVRSKLGDRDIPVMDNVSAGHEWDAHKSAPNLSLCLGRRVRLEVAGDKASLRYL